MQLRLEGVPATVELLKFFRRDRCNLRVESERGCKIGFARAPSGPIEHAILTYLLVVVNLLAVLRPLRYHVSHVPTTTFETGHEELIRAFFL